MLLVKANPELKNVFQRLIKTMQMPVTWTDVFVITNNVLILAGDVRSLVFNFDNKRVYTTILEVPLESAQLETIPSDNLLNNVMNITLYAFGKWGAISGLKVDKDYHALNALFAQILRPVNVEPGFGANNFRFFKGGVQITYEDAMIAVLRILRDEGKLNERQSLVTSETKDTGKEERQKDPANEKAAGKEPNGQNPANTQEPENKQGNIYSNDYEDDYEADYEIGLWHNLCWKTDSLSFGKAPKSNNDAAKSRIGRNFYMTNYLCPKCSEKLYMGVYPTDREVLIETEEGRVFMARTYACHNCNALYTPRPKKLLQEGDIYILKFDEDRTAYEDYLDILGLRAARTTNPNFNEFESERNAAGQKEADGQETAQSAAEDINTAKASPASKIRSFKERLSKRGRKFFSKRKGEPDDTPQDGNIIQDVADTKSLAHNTDNQNIPMHDSNAGNLDAQNAETDNSDLHGVHSDVVNPDNIHSDIVSSDKINSDNARSTNVNFDTIHSDNVNSGSTRSNVVNAGNTEPINPPASDITAKHTKTENAKPSNDPQQPPSRFTQAAALLPGKTTDELKAILSDLERKNSGAAVSGADPEYIHYSDAVRETLKNKLSAKYDARMGALSNLAPRQLNDLKNQISHEAALPQDKKDEYTKQIDAFLYQAETKALAQKVEISRKKSYSEIEQIIKDVESRDIPEELKQDALDKLTQIKSSRARQEAEYLITHMPLHLDTKQLASYIERLNQYKEADLTPYRSKLETRRDMAEKEEISAMIKRGGKKDRGALWSLYEDLQTRDYKESNKAPFLEKIYDRIRHLDEDAIERICPSIVTLSFDEGLKAYEEISQGMFLPELKTDTLEMIKRRLTKLKTDESVQLMLKLKNEIDEKMTDSEGFYFYNAREELRAASNARNTNRSRSNEESRKEGSENHNESNDDEHSAMLRAINGYASSRGEYEYPLMVCDTSRSKNGREGFVLTPDHIFYHAFLNSGIISISNISSVKYVKNILSKNIFVKLNGFPKQKLPNSVNQEERETFAKILDDFVSYLKEKPESRNIEYMAKEKHDVIHCYRCGFVYKSGNVCPKCGSKMNR